MRLQATCCAPAIVAALPESGHNCTATPSFGDAMGGQPRFAVGFRIPGGMACG